MSVFGRDELSFQAPWGDGGTVPSGRAESHVLPADVTDIALYTDFAAVEDLWRTFAASACGTAFQSYDWLFAWYMNVGRGLGVCPSIIVLSLNGEPVMLAPFGLDRYCGLRRITWMGGRLNDYKGPFIRSDYARRMTKERFRQEWKRIRRVLPPHDLVMLENQPAFYGSPLAPVPNPFVTLPGAVAPDAGYVFDLPESFDELARRYRAETRRIDRSKLRKLEAAGELIFHIAETPEERSAMVSVILARKAAQLSAQGIHSIFEEEPYLAAWQDLAALPEERKLLEVAELRLDGEFLSGSIGHVWNGHNTLMVHTYDPQKYPRLSPGRQHLLKLLQSSIDRKIRIYDLSVGYLPYKESFCDEPMPLWNSITGAGLFGHPVALVMQAALGFKRFIKHEYRLMELLHYLRARFA